jgi:hypothetical protein
VPEWPIENEDGMVRGTNSVSRMGGGPGMADMRKEVRGERGEECAS